MPTTRLPDSAHTSQSWRIHEIAADFRLEDVWELPTPGGPDDFPRLLELFRSFDPAKTSSRAVRALFAIRWKIGELFAWDERSAGDAGSFTTLYESDNEWAGEIVNRTVDGILHLGWVPDESGDGYRGQMAVLVRPNGILGHAYMRAIRPFRHLIVYPRMLRELGRGWQVGDESGASGRS